MLQQDRQEWVDGFLFVGNHPALDFLNTRLVNADEPVELLPDTGSLTRWLVASGILRDAAALSTLRAWQDSRGAQRFLRELLIFREQLRAALLRIEAGKVPEHFLEEVNAKLSLYPRRQKLKRVGKLIERTTLLELNNPLALWSEIAGSVSDLFTEVPFPRLRQCEGCVVHFHDISKKGSRRWCSMSLCGNRDKVATYRRKQREGDTSR